jgi:hypothetical protein
MKRTLTIVIAVLTILLHAMAVNAQQPSTPTLEEHTSAPPPATVTGSGTANYIPLWTGSSTLGNSKVYQTGGKIGVGTTAPTVALDVNGRLNVSKSYRIGGTDVLSTSGSTGNTAVGEQALLANTGDDNTGLGFQAMRNASAAFFNTAIGEGTLYDNSSGGNNTAVGGSALGQNITGSNNTALGYEAGLFISGSNNVMIQSMGTSTDNGVIRIGTSGTQGSFFAAGISGVTTGVNDAVPVVVDSNGQLGTVSSSRRFKENIEDMGKVSEGLMRLRPVTFRYQKPFADGSKPLQYGLVAEEVAEVYPDLVTRSADGQVETVKYQVLDSMLLNEVQRQQNEIRSLQERIANLESVLASTSRAPGERSTPASAR